MKVLETIRKIGNTIYDACSSLFDEIFNVLFGPFKVANIVDTYCNEHYRMTPGGVIIKDK